jgi:hypothetical protein
MWFYRLLCLFLFFCFGKSQPFLFVTVLIYCCCFWFMWTEYVSLMKKNGFYWHCTWGLLPLIGKTNLKILFLQNSSKKKLSCRNSSFDYCWAKWKLLFIFRKPSYCKTIRKQSCFRIFIKAIFPTKVASIELTSK